MTQTLSPIVNVAAAAVVTALFVFGPLAIGQTAELDVSRRSSEPALADAAEARDWSRTADLLADGVAVDAAQPDGMTALHWAVYRYHLPTVVRLIEAGADLDRATRYGVTPLSIACELGHVEVIKTLLAAGADADAERPGKVSMLMIAARTGKVEPVRQLLKHGARVDALERNGQTALMWAAAEGHAEVVEKLLSAGADPAVALESGFTAMMFAAREGHADVIRRFLDHGSDVAAVMQPETKPKARDPRVGTSALTLAVESGHFELALMLVDEGADPNDQRSSYTPLHAVTWVRKANRGEGTDGDPPPRGSGRVGSLEFVRQLVARGADVNLQLAAGKAGGKAQLNHRDATPFLLAAKTADLALLELLVELGADPTLPNVDGCTPLMAAAGIGVTAVGEEAGTEPEVLAAVQFLFDLGGDVNTVDENGETAMHGAAYRLYPQVAVLLGELGADPHIWHHKNKHGWTPHLIAQGYRPGSFKPSPEMIAVIEAALVDAGIEPPPLKNAKEKEEVDRWAKPKPKPAATQQAATSAADSVEQSDDER